MTVKIGRYDSFPRTKQSDLLVLMRVFPAILVAVAFNNPSQN